MAEPAAQPSITLRTQPARAGWSWVQQGIGVCARRPLVFASMLVLTTLGFNILASIPLVGPVIAFAAMPYAWLAFMRATRHALTGQPVGLQVFAEIWRVPQPCRVALVRISTLYASAVMAAIAIVMLACLGLADPGVLEKLRNAATLQELQAIVVQGGLRPYLLLLSALMSLVSVVFWHAPALAHALALPPSKALFFSVLACWHNRGAFTVYGLGWTALVFAVGTAAGLAAQVLGSPAVALVIGLPALLLLAASFYASLYFSTAECFQAKDGTPSGEPLNRPA